jgi:predicted O-methyltransferase YrrM
VNPAQVRSVIEQLLRDGTVVSRTDGTEHTLAPIAITAEEGEALRDCVVRERAVQTIEVGLAYGISALFVCEGLAINGDERARHTVIDPHQARSFSNCGLQVLDDAGFTPRLDVYAEESQRALPRLLEDERRFDLGVLDANHRFDAVFVDLVYLGRLLRPGAVVFLDDYQLPGVARAGSFFVTNVGWRIESVSAPDALHQWAVLRTPTTPDTRPFDAFVDF